jgi:PTH1 family peptidyl-tRNA hydrolase
VWLIVGLGNPEGEYARTRHNVGFEVADVLAERCGVRFSDKKFKAHVARAVIAGESCVLLKPQTYMNLSGESVGPAAGFFKLSPGEVIAIHDDLDLELGRVKVKKGGGHGGHNGLRSLIQHLPDDGFVRVRIGIGRPPAGWDPADYVLAAFLRDERDEAERAVNTAAKAVVSILEKGLDKAMNEVNRDTTGRKNEKNEKDV